jgi:PIN domain nuclease of toxin-antitoxin system
MTVIDTHVWIWYVNETPVFSKRAAAALQEADQLGVSAISCWETAMLVAKQRLKLTMDVHEWIHSALQRPKIRLLPLEPSISVLSTRLPGSLHADPADRIIAATCLYHHTPLITKDKSIHDWGIVQAIW